MVARFRVPAFILPALVGGAIAIEAPPQDQAVAEAAVESCNQALGQPLCRLAGAADISADFYVRVAFFDEQQLEAQVEIRREPSRDAAVAVRHVSFAAADDLRQRYRALGLIVAAYVVAHPEPEPPVVEAPPPKPPPPPPPTPQPEPALETTPAEPSIAVGADLAALVGAGLQRGAPRFGLLLRGHVRFGELPLRPLIALRVAHRAEQPELYWLSAGAGLSAELLPDAAPFGVAFRGEFVAERVIAEIDDPMSGRGASGAEWRLGGRLGADLLLRLSRGSWLFAGGDASLLAPRVHLEVRGEDAGVDPTLGWAASLGVRVVP